MRLLALYVTFGKASTSSKTLNMVVGGSQEEAIWKGKDGRTYQWDLKQSM